MMLYHVIVTTWPCDFFHPIHSLLYFCKVPDGSVGDGTALVVVSWIWQFVMVWPESPAGVRPDLMLLLKSGETPLPSVSEQNTGTMLQHTKESFGFWITTELQKSRHGCKYIITEIHFCVRVYFYIFFLLTCCLVWYILFKLKTRKSNTIYVDTSDHSITFWIHGAIGLLLESFIFAVCMP